MTTLKELSECTGFSQATISRVLNEDPTMSVTDATRDAILTAAGKLQYKGVKRAHKQEKDKRTGLRVAIAEMLTPAEQLADPYYLYLKTFAEKFVLDRHIELCRLCYEGNTYRMAPEAEVDGVLAIGIFTDEQIEALSAISQNLVFLDSSPDETRFDSVVLNFELGVERALDHLYAQGHREIGFIGPNRKYDARKRPAPEVRRLCFVSYMRNRGLLREEYLFETPMEALAAREALLTRIQDGKKMPTALLAANEAAAIGAVGALRESGLTVPGEVSIISFNDTVISSLIDPPLTSISTHVEQMSTAAASILLRRAVERREGEEFLPLKIIVPPSLIERQSVAEPCRREAEPYTAKTGIVPMESTHVIDLYFGNLRRTM